MGGVRRAPTSVLSADEIERLWLEYKNDGCPGARERLIVHYMQLAGFVAGVVGAGVPKSVERDDLVSSGTIGLIEALDRFDLGRSVKFETYASTRVRGAMLDEMRALDWVPRSMRTKATAVERAMTKLQATLQRTPTTGELANELGIDVADLYDLLHAMARMHVMLETVMLLTAPDDNEASGALDSIADHDTDVPGIALEEDETRRTLLDAVRTLDDRERTMIALYYFEGYTLARIGKIFGVSESRVSQIHSRALQELRRAEDVLACGESLGLTMRAGRKKQSTVDELDAIRIARTRRPARKSA